MLLYHYQEVQESVSNIVDVGLRQGPQAAAQAQAVAQAAPQHFEEKGNFAAGLTKTVEETGGLLTGVIKKYNIYEFNLRTAPYTQIVEGFLCFCTFYFPPIKSYVHNYYSILE